MIKTVCDKCEKDLNKSTGKLCVKMLSVERPTGVDHSSDPELLKLLDSEGELCWDCFVSLCT